MTSTPKKAAARPKAKPAGKPSRVRTRRSTPRSEPVRERRGARAAPARKLALPGAPAGRGLGWLFDIVPEGLLVTEGQSVLVANETACAWAGQRPEQFAGMELKSLFLAASVNEIIRARRADSHRVLRLTGKGPLASRHFEALVLPIPPEASKAVHGWALFLRDISDRVELEQMQASLGEIVAQLVRTRDPDAVLQQVAEAIRRHGRFKRVLVTLLDEQMNDVRYIHSGLSREEERWLQEETPWTGEERRQIFQDQFRMGQCYYIPHDLVPWGKEAGVPVLAPSFTEYKNWHPEDFLFIPLQEQDGRVLAIISVDEPEDGRLPSQERMRIVENFAELATIALYNAGLWAKIERQAVTDALTGVFNRHFFNEFLTKESVRATREGKRFTLLIVDLDGFKEINDHYGHLVGDKALVAVAKILNASTRTSDVVARFGGDEFVVLLPDTNADEASVVQGRIHKLLDEHNRRRSKDEPEVRLSIGHSEGASTDILWLLETADRQMYEQKKGKK